MAEEVLLQCYNKGCGKKFKADSNSDDACHFHPGVPVFHDAMKGWSCCKKRSTDFTEFLNFPGCTSGRHNSVKPPEPEKKVEKPLGKDEVITVGRPKHRKPQKPQVPIERPPDDAPFSKLKVTVAGSLKALLARQQKQKEEEEKTKETAGSPQEGATSDDVVKIGTLCRNKGCKVTYADGELPPCQYHSGIAIFHEGLKFWSCCRKRTTEFTEFLKQPGCTTGDHVWKPTGEETAAKALCRYDWHQTGGFVIISIYAKGCLPDKSSVEVNQTNASISLVYNQGESQHEMKLALYGVIIPEKSSMELLGTKAEIKLKKAEPMSWSSLELVKKPQVTTNENDSSNNKNTSAATPADAKTNIHTDKEKA